MKATHRICIYIVDNMNYMKRTMGTQNKPGIWHSTNGREAYGCR